MAETSRGRRGCGCTQEELRTVVGDELPVRELLLVLKAVALYGGE